MTGAQTRQPHEYQHKVLASHGFRVPWYLQLAGALRPEPIPNTLTSPQGTPRVPEQCPRPSPAPTSHPRCPATQSSGRPRGPRSAGPPGCPLCRSHGWSGEGLFRPSGWSHRDHLARRSQTGTGSQALALPQNWLSLQWPPWSLGSPHLKRQRSLSLFPSTRHRSGTFPGLAVCLLVLSAKAFPLLTLSTRSRFLVLPWPP